MKYNIWDEPLSVDHMLTEKLASLKAVCPTTESLQIALRMTFTVDEKDLI